MLKVNSRTPDRNMLARKYKMSRCTVYNTPAKHNGTDNTREVKTILLLFL